MDFTLCALFYKEPIKYKTFTLSSLQKQPIQDRAQYIKNIYMNNIESLVKSIDFCIENRISNYRIPSDIFPKLSFIIRNSILTEIELESIFNKLKQIDTKEIYLSAHPEQFIQLASLEDSIIENSIETLEESFILSNYIPLKEINIHIGGVYGDKKGAIKRWLDVFEKKIDERYKNLITIENDEFSYSINDVIDISKQANIRAVFDIHHHKCYSIKNSLDFTDYQFFLKAKESWRSDEKQRIHISTPKIGEYITAFKSRAHSDIIDISFVPDWIFSEQNIVIDVEAKYKEIAISEFRKHFKE
ncbi:hypothetical protein JXR93_05650 [bacterium]|nr:hypothetical protein [bacterium]